MSAMVIRRRVVQSTTTLLAVVGLLLTGCGSHGQLSAQPQRANPADAPIAALVRQTLAIYHKEATNLIIRVNGSTAQARAIVISKPVGSCQRLHFTASLIRAQGTWKISSYATDYCTDATEEAASETMKKLGGVELIYGAAPLGSQLVSSQTLQTAVNVVRKRLVNLHPRALWVGPDLASPGVVALIAGVSPTRTEAVRLGRTGQLFFYDWESNVIGPSGKPAPDESVVTGGVNAGSAIYGLSEYQAILRAAKRPAIIRPNDTSLRPGCRPQGVDGCIYGQWYLLDAARHTVLRGPADSQKDLYAEGYRPPSGAESRIVRINPGTVLVRALPVEGAGGKITVSSPESWYVLNDDPALTNADIETPQQGFASGAGSQPVVTFGFTSRGGQIFERMTREIARRGQGAQLPGVSKQAAEQHFAVVLDEQLIAVPSIDYTRYPEGIDPTKGSEIYGGFTLTSAKNLADELQSGALPIKLDLISQSKVSTTKGK